MSALARFQYTTTRKYTFARALFTNLLIFILVKNSKNKKEESLKISKGLKKGPGIGLGIKYIAIIVGIQCN